MKSHRKEILFFIESFSGGGAERVLLTILRNLDLSRFKIKVLVLNDIGTYSKDFHALDIDVVPVIKSKWNLINKVKYKLLYDILPPTIAARWIFNNITADSYVAFVEGYATKIISNFKINKKKIAWVHIDLKDFPWTIEKKIYKDTSEEISAYRKFDNVIGVSKDVSKILSTDYGLRKVTTIYNPIDEQRIKLLSEKDYDAVDTSFFNIVSVGRLTKQKGYDRLISLMPDILAKNPKLKLYIVGEGEEQKNLEYQIDKMGVSQNVILTGFIPNPYSLMKQMDLFVCSSVAEGFSLVIAEALILGMPVVSTRCSGPVELLDNGKYGILCHSYEELRRIIVKLSQSTEKLKELKELAQERSRFFNTQEIIKQIQSIL